MPPCCAPAAVYLFVWPLRSIRAATLLPLGSTQLPPATLPCHQAAQLSPDNILMREGTYRAIGECFPHLRTKVGWQRFAEAQQAWHARPLRLGLSRLSRWRGEHRRSPLPLPEAVVCSGLAAHVCCGCSYMRVPPCTRRWTLARGTHRSCASSSRPPTSRVCALCCYRADATLACCLLRLRLLLQNPVLHETAVHLPLCAALNSLHVPSPSSAHPLRRCALLPIPLHL